MCEEIWQDIFGTGYKVSNMGNIKSRYGAEHKVLQPTPRGNGPYLAIDLHERTTYVHQEVAKAFLGVKPDGLEINHINGNRYDNRSVNLEYVTRLSNVQHATKQGKYSRSGLTVEMVKEIKRLYQLNVGPSKIAKQFKIAPSSVCDIVKGRTWKHVEE